LEATRSADEKPQSVVTGASLGVQLGAHSFAARRDSASRRSWALQRQRRRCWKGAGHADPV